MAQEESKGTVFIIYYSAYGHVHTMANAVAKGIREKGLTAELYTVADARTELPHQKEAKRIFIKPEDRQAFIDEHKDDGVCIEGHIIIDDLAKADGFMFGLPTRFGMAPAKIKTLMDNLGTFWFTGKGLYGKPAGIFFGTGTQGGGQETTALTFVTQLVHHGMIYVPIGYAGAFNPLLTNLEIIHGGSPYGSGTIAGPMGKRQPNEIELKLAQEQGKYFARKVPPLKAALAEQEAEEAAAAAAAKQ